jgi:hypothetical protein
LQATHGVVSGEPVFFRRAFGESFDQFEEILSRPHHFIFNRDWYEQHGGRAEFEAYQTQMGRLSRSQRQELLVTLSSADPSRFRQLATNALDPAIKAALRFYIPISKQDEMEIWRLRKVPADQCDMPSEERVEDAGLEDDDLQSAIELTSAAQEMTHG